MDHSHLAVASAPGWRLVLALDRDRRPIDGSPEELRRAIRAGADLRIYSEFYHDEHIDPGSSNHELVQESMDMRATYLIDDRWAAGVLSLRQPVQLPDGFGPRPSLSLFLYSEDGSQAIARPFLDGAPVDGPRGISPPADHAQMPRYHELDRWDDGTNAPSSNFIYDFETLRYFVRDDWREVLHHTSDGTVVSGSIDNLADAFRRGAEFKVGIRGLCADLSANPTRAPRQAADEKRPAAARSLHPAWLVLLLHAAKTVHRRDSPPAPRHSQRAPAIHNGRLGLHLAPLTHRRSRGPFDL